MSADYLYIADLAREVEIPANGIISRTLYNDDRIKVVLFGFDKGQELSEHTSTMPATVHILRGEARLKLGQDEKAAGEGSWAYMPPQLPHTVVAMTPVVMLLVMVKAG
jgi:quercetin dioxygenase-like cupin family protein